MRWHSWERRLRDTMCQRHRYNRIGEHECRSFRSKRYLVEKYSHVYSDEPPRYPGKASSWSCVVLDRNHTFPLLTLSVTSYSSLYNIVTNLAPEILMEREIAPLSRVCTRRLVRPNTIDELLLPVRPFQ